ncbi:hypothetical protein [Mycobacterium sp. pW045]|uniref:hypothetical protein n=1 Tax=Mycobacterium sp. pW045 TaxID=3238984 RepID=UPI00351AE610
MADAVAAELARLAKRAAKAAERKSAAEASARLDRPVDNLMDGKQAAESERGDDDDAAAVAADDADDLISPQTVEEILKNYGIPSYASKAIPVPLRVQRIYFSGVKVLPATHRLAEGYDVIIPDDESAADTSEHAALSDAAEAELDFGGADNDEVDPSDDEPSEGGEVENAPQVAVPFLWSWEPQSGVNGVGSGRNLRGKSTVLNVLMWALSGRCANFQVDSKKWIKHVAVDWLIGPETLRVEFDCANGHAVGTVAVVTTVGGVERSRVVGRFDGEEEFEGVMGSVMMTRLRLEEIPMWTTDREVVHRWPAYASAFAVRAENLDPVVGNVTVLGTRMLQMFVGTDWGPALAATQAALKEVEAQRSAAQEKAQAADQVISDQRQKAQATVDRLKAAVKAINDENPDLAQVLAATASATELAREVHNLERRLMVLDSHLDTVQLQLKAAKARNHTQLEDALATKFFHQMQPIVCPRCTSAITAEQQAAEVEKHECSLCSKGLDLGDVDAPATAAQERPMNAHRDAPVDDVEALNAALDDVKHQIEALGAQIAAKKDELTSAEALSVAGTQQISAAGERRALELDLARAEGALTVFSGSSGSLVDDPVNATITAVLGAADTVLSKWVRDEQGPLLKAISADIESLAVGFGADSLASVKLGGGGRLDVAKGGERTTYSGLTPGEKLRVKIAAAVALIKHGYVAGIGRHPGFLVLDSPAAEEMPEEDLAVLVGALVEVAQQADMQIFVGTRSANPLMDLLPEPNRRVAVGDEYLW